MKRWHFIYFLFLVALGLYMMNFHFEFISIPDSFSEYNGWIFALGGLFVIIGAIDHLRVSRKRWNLPGY